MDIARFTYNKQLELKINTYKETGKNLSQFDLNNSLVGLKKEHKFLKKVHSQALQNINQRISFAFNGFYNRVQKGEKPGFPHFKGRNRYESITYPQSGFSLEEKLYLSKIGKMNIVQHRAIEGKIKSLTIRQTPTGKWFATFCAEQDKKKAVRNDFVMAGIDLGLNHFYADSLGKNMGRTIIYSGTIQTDCYQNISLKLQIKGAWRTN